MIDDFPSNLRAGRQTPFGCDTRRSATATLNDEKMGLEPFER